MTDTPQDEVLTDEELLYLEDSERVEGCDEEWWGMFERAIAELRRHRSSPSSAWRDIKDAPKDGVEFQAWVGHWEPRCRYNDDGAFQIWGRTDYDQDGWDVYWNLIPTHYMPAPEAPAEPPK